MAAAREKNRIRAETAGERKRAGGKRSVTARIFCYFYY